MTDRQDELAEAWASARPRLVRVAYALLGSLAEAEDVVADCWFRLVRADGNARVGDVEAWAVVAVSRAALDVLRSARVRRESYPGPWLPEPVVDPTAFGEDPADRVTLDDEVSYALLVVLETLSPAERTSWVMHDLFGVPFAQVADTVGRTPAAVRQLAARARAHLKTQTPRTRTTPAEHDETVERFLRATSDGDLRALLAVLDPQVVLTSDGGGAVVAARRPVQGAEPVARFVLTVTARRPAAEEVRPLSVNGRLGVAQLLGTELTAVTSLTVVDGVVTRIDIIRAPAKLRRGRSGGVGATGAEG